MENNTQVKIDGKKVLSDIVCMTKYAKHLRKERRRENWKEIVSRNEEMHIRKFPHLEDEIRSVYRGVYNVKYFPSMRSLQFAGAAIEAINERIYNCCYAPLVDLKVIKELMYLLLCGCGTGFSVRKRHISQLPGVLPRVNVPNEIYFIKDTIAGWADSVEVLLKSYLVEAKNITFDFSLIRPKGTPLVTSGGKAPGPEPLRVALENVRRVLENSKVGPLSSFQLHRIMCHLSDAVRSGGIRRSAMIVLADPDDQEMIECKTGLWWETYPELARANNTIVFIRGQVSKERFLEIWKKVKESNGGEPGIYFSNDEEEESGVNPCNEASLNEFTFCNLVTINASDISSQEDLEDRSRGATFISTLQASYTNFEYLSERWKVNTERDALIGVSMTGIAAGTVLGCDLTKAAKIVIEENVRVSKLLGINCAARTTLLKPEGSASLVVGTSSGLHAWHGPQYIRRMEVDKSETIYAFFKEKAPKLVEDNLFTCTRYVLHAGKVVGFDEKKNSIVEIDRDRKIMELETKDPLYSFYQKHTPQLLDPIPESATGAKLCFPVVAPEGSIHRGESTMDFLERVKKINLEWIRPGHKRGINSHNASATVSIKKHEWDEVGEWLWNNRDHYNGVAVLPFDDFVYKQPPFEDCDMETIDWMEKELAKIDISEMIEDEVDIDFVSEVSCSGEKCERPIPLSASMQ